VNSTDTGLEQEAFFITGNRALKKTKQTLKTISTEFVRTIEFSPGLQADSPGWSDDIVEILLLGY
jgi:hypothetical protein